MGDDQTQDVSAGDVEEHVDDVKLKAKGVPAAALCVAARLELSLVSVEPAQVKRHGVEGAFVRHDDDLVGTWQSLSSTLKNMTSSGTSLLFMTSSRNC